MLIRDERSCDVDAIRSLVSSAFPTDAEARLIDKLRAANRLTISLVVESNNRIIGHIAFSPVAAATGASSIGLGLAPLSVVETERRRGVGAALVRAGLERCRETGIPFVAVLGEPGYYGRLGFHAAEEFGLYDAYGGGAAFQVLELRERGAPRDGGLVRYAPEFAIFEAGASS